jgi:hypothetical protein
MSCEPNHFKLPGRASVCLDPSTKRLDVIRDTAHSTAPFHSSTVQAFANTLAMPPAHAILVGFGKRGVFYTGAGNDRDLDRTKYMSKVNVAETKAAYDAQSSAAAFSLALCGCQVGAGPKGGEFISLLANQLGIPVSAPTGFVFPDVPCNQLYLEPGAEWITAIPNKALEFIDSPPLPDGPINDNIIIFFGPDPVPVPRKDLTRIRYYDADGRSFGPFENDDAVGLLPVVRLDLPFTAGPATLAVETGKVDIWLRGLPTARRYQIFNDRIMQDTQNPTVYYYLNAAALVAV